MEMIEFFGKNNLFELVEKSFALINDPSTYKAQIILCKLEQYKENYNKCLELLDKQYEKSNSEKGSQDKSKKKEIEEIITIKSNICYISGKHTRSPHPVSEREK